MRGRTAVAAALALMPALGWASAGYFQHGYGLKSKAMGGVGIALPQDSLVPAVNPAGMVRVGNRIDASLEWFEPKVGSEVRGNTAGLDGSRDASGRGPFLVPELGSTRMLGERWAVGAAVFANGGATHYRENPFPFAGGTVPAGLEFRQIFVSPALAARIGGSHSIGVTLNFVTQSFSAKGLEHFDDPAFTSSPGNVTNRGWARSSGQSLRLGWMGDLLPGVTAGATWQQKTRMGRLDRYRGLLADQGGFDVPENYGFGLSVQAHPRLVLAADVQRIEYAKVPSIGNSSQCFLATTCLLGTINGPGAGWRNVTVKKLGVAWEALPGYTLRAGLVKLRQPIPETETLLNLLAPAVGEEQLTAGLTWQIDKAFELSLAGLYGRPRTVRGVNSIPPGAASGGGEADLRMRQRSLGFALGWRL